MEIMSVQVITLVLVAIVSILVVSALFRRPSSNLGLQSSDVKELKRSLEQKENNLREAWKNADKFEALAGERKEEIERQKADLLTLRAKLETEFKAQQSLSNEISRLEAEMAAERASSEEKIQVLSKIQEDMKLSFKDLAVQALERQGEHFSKSSQEKLQATLIPLK